MLEQLSTNQIKNKKQQIHSISCIRKKLKTELATKSKL